MKQLIIMWVLIVLFLAGCGKAEHVKTEEIIPTIVDDNNAKVVGVTSQGTPIIPVCDTDDFQFVDTPDSTCFSKIGYSRDTKTLYVTFLDSDASYIYEDVPESVWDELCNADSKGRYYNAEIKGCYYCSKIG